MKAVKPDATAACISVLVEEANAYCENPGGHCPEPPEGTAVPFKPNIALSHDDFVTSDYLTGQGQATYFMEEDDCWDLISYVDVDPCKDNWRLCNVVATKVLGYFSGWNWIPPKKDDPGYWVFASEQCIRFIAVPNPDSECGYDYIPATDPADIADLDECKGDHPSEEDLSGLCADNITLLDPPPE
jgi:hypothetical protein